MRLKDLIKQVRSCKTAAEEREVIAKESAVLRESFRDADQSHRHRNVAKLMYIHMLGYPTHFGQMETLKLIAAPGFPEKRMGYLGLMILLDERQEVLMLVTNSLKMDMNNTKNLYTVGLALVALGNICSAAMARDLAPDIERLLEQGNPYVRKKAALCAIRILRKCPEMAEQLAERAVELLNDRNQAVVLCGVALMLQVVETEPGYVPRYRECVPALCRILRSLLQPGMSPEHDVAGITNPFLQVKILRLLRVLGEGSAEASDVMGDILAQVASSVEASRNAGYAILYECVQTIMGIESGSGSRVLAVNILGRFLANKDNNIRYVALNTLLRVIAVDINAVQRHRGTLVDCVRDADVTIRRRALELVVSLVNTANIKALTKELLDYLTSCDTEFKPDLTARICAMIDRFAPDKRWHIDQMFAVLVQSGAHVKDGVCRTFLLLVMSVADLTPYATRQAYRCLSAHMEHATPALVNTCAWIVGEFGEMLLGGATGGPLLEGESPLAVVDQQVVSLLETSLKRYSEESVREVLLTALLKLTARLPGQVPRLRSLIAKYRTSSAVEVQTRACEFSKIFSPAYDAMRPSLLERMPTPSEARAAAAGTEAAAPAAAGAGSAPAAASSILPTASNDLLALDLLADALGGVGGGAVLRGSAGDLDALLALGAPASPPQPQQHSLNNGLGGADLLALLAQSVPAAPPAPSTSAPPAPQDPFALLLGGSASPPPPTQALPGGGGGLPASSPLPAHFPSIVAWANAQHSVQVVFSFTKPAGRPECTTVVATITNNGLNDVSRVLLQVAPGKHMRAEIEPPSGASLPVLGAPITSRFHMVNSEQGVKPFALKIRVSFVVDATGEALVDTVEVRNLPPGL